jgi:hypothetical protein
MLDKSPCRFLSPYEKRLLEVRPDRPVPAHIWQTIGYRPNEWSFYHVFTSGARWNAFATSRQAGKTDAEEIDLLDALYEPPRDDDQTHDRDSEGNIISVNPNYVGVFSDTYEHAELVVLPFIERLTTLIGESGFDLNMNKHVLTVKKTKAQLHWFSSENPRAGQGHTFSRGYFEESQNISDEFFTNVRPAFGARMARIFAFGTPDPVVESTWFEGLYLRGQDEDDLDAYSYSIACFVNKWLPMEDIRDAMNTLSEREFRMKYLGQFVRHEGAVFQKPETCFTGSLVAKVTFPNGKATVTQYAELDPRARYSMGLDLAKNQDFTVAYVIDTRTKAVVGSMRINRLDYVRVGDGVETLAKHFRVRRIRMDTTGVGEAVSDMLKKRGLNIIDFTFTNKSKERLVSTVVREIEHKRLVLPKEDTQLLRELKAFARTVSKAGNVIYSAPANAHDDTVMALGLAAIECGSSVQARVSNYVYGEAA